MAMTNPDKGIWSERPDGSVQVVPAEEPTIPVMLDESFPWERQETRPFQFDPGLVRIPPGRDVRIVVTEAAKIRVEESVRRSTARLPGSVREAFLGGAGLIGSALDEDDDSGLDGLFE